MMGCFPFLCVGMLDVPGYGSLSYQSDSSFPVMSLRYTSSFYADPTTFCDLDLSDSVLSLSTPFVLGAASALGGCCGFPVSNGL
jgi:hypothetical protein